MHVKLVWFVVFMISCTLVRPALGGDAQDVERDLRYLSAKAPYNYAARFLLLNVSPFALSDINYLHLVNMCQQMTAFYSEKDLLKGELGSQSFIVVGPPTPWEPEFMALVLQGCRSDCPVSRVFYPADQEPDGKFGVFLNRIKNVNSESPCGLSVVVGLQDVMRVHFMLSRDTRATVQVAWVFLFYTSERDSVTGLAALQRPAYLPLGGRSSGHTRDIGYVTDRFVHRHHLAAIVETPIVPGSAFAQHVGGVVAVAAATPYVLLDDPLADRTCDPFAGTVKMVECYRISRSLMRFADEFSQSKSGSLIAPLFPSLFSKLKADKPWWFLPEAIDLLAIESRFQALQSQGRLLGPVPGLSVDSCALEPQCEPEEAPVFGPPPPPPPKSFVWPAFLRPVRKAARQYSKGVGIIRDTIRDKADDFGVTPYLTKARTVATGVLGAPRDSARSLLARFLNSAAERLDRSGEYLYVHVELFVVMATNTYSDFIYSQPAPCTALDTVGPPPASPGRPKSKYHSRPWPGPQGHDPGGDEEVVLVEDFVSERPYFRLWAVPLRLPASLSAGLLLPSPKDPEPVFRIPSDDQHYPSCFNASLTCYTEDEADPWKVFQKVSRYSYRPKRRFDSYSRSQRRAALAAATARAILKPPRYVLLVDSIYRNVFLLFGFVRGYIFAIYNEVVFTLVALFSPFVQLYEWCSVGLSYLTDLFVVVAQNYWAVLYYKILAVISSCSLAVVWAKWFLPHYHSTPIPRPPVAAVGAVPVATIDYFLADNQLVSEGQHMPSACTELSASLRRAQGMGFALFVAATPTILQTNVDVVQIPLLRVLAAKVVDDLGAFVSFSVLRIPFPRGDYQQLSSGAVLVVGNLYQAFLQARGHFDFVAHLSEVDDADVHLTAALDPAANDLVVTFAVCPAARNLFQRFLYRCSPFLARHLLPPQADWIDLTRTPVYPAAVLGMGAPSNLVSAAVSGHLSSLASMALKDGCISAQGVNNLRSKARSLLIEEHRTLPTLPAVMAAHEALVDTIVVNSLQRAKASDGALRRSLDAYGIKILDR